METIFPNGFLDEQAKDESFLLKPLSWSRLKHPTLEIV